MKKLGTTLEIGEKTGCTTASVNLAAGVFAISDVINFCDTGKDLGFRNFIKNSKQKEFQHIFSYIKIKKTFTKMYQSAPLKLSKSDEENLGNK